MYKKLTLTGCLILFIACIEEMAARKIPGFASWFCENIYQTSSQIFRKISGIFPFSVVELMLYGLIIYLIAGFLYSIMKKCIAKYLAVTLFILSVIAFLYVNNCGINYYAPGFAKQTGMQLYQYDVEVLEQVCLYLADKTEEYAGKIERDEENLLVEKNDWREQASAAMNRLGSIEEPLEGTYPLPKPVKISYILSVQKVTGVYSPFTVEANYNNAIPTYNKPFTMCHELSHLKGFMQEKEANFIAYRACIASEDDTFCYSGYLSALIYCTNALYRINPEKCNAIWQERSEGVLADVRNNNAFWRKYDGRASELHEKVNDSYLKANGQAEGVAGYDYMVDLIVAWMVENTG